VIKENSLKTLTLVVICPQGIGRHNFAIVLLNRKK